MARKQIALTSQDEKNISIEMSKEDFSGFLASLLGTPRDERRKFIGGFDLTLSELKLILEKLLHKVKTDHELLSSEFNAEINFEGEVSTVVNSFNQFFNQPDIRDDEIEEVTITLSWLIPFYRSDSKKNYEKQMLSIRFIAGPIGIVEVSIRSTELTWPAGYFNIFEKNWTQVTNKFANFENNLLNKILFLTFMFRKGSSDNYSNKSQTFRSIINFIFVPTAIMFFFITIYENNNRGNTSAVYNPKTNTIERVDANKLIEKEGWKVAIDSINKTKILSKLKGIDVKDPKKTTTFSNFKKIVLNKYTFTLIGIISFFVFCNWMHAIKRDAALAGRIYIFSENLPPRETRNFYPALIGSLFVGVVSSIIVNIFTSFFI